MAQQVHYRVHQLARLHGGILLRWIASRQCGLLFLIICLLTLFQAMFVFHLLGRTTVLVAFDLEEVNGSVHDKPSVVELVNVDATGIYALSEELIVGSELVGCAVLRDSVVNKPTMADCKAFYYHYHS